MNRPSLDVLLEELRVVGEDLSLLEERSSLEELVKVVERAKQAGVDVTHELAAIQMRLVEIQN